MNLDSLLDNFHQFAFRVETLPLYNIGGIEYDNFQKYLKGKPITEIINKEWINFLKEKTNEDKVFKRIRVIPEYLTNYIKYEFEYGYTKNDIAGEEILVISQKTYDHYVKNKIKGDFWIFDNEYVFKMNYNNEGVFLGSTLIEDNDLINQYIDLFEKLIAHAIPYRKIIKDIHLTTVKVNI